MKGIPRSPQWVPIWWFVWMGVVGQQLYFFLGRPASIHEEFFARLGPWTYALLCAQIALSVIIRWWVCPRLTSSVASFFAFVLGIAVVGAAGLSTLFTHMPHERLLFWVCFAALMQFVPIPASRRALRDKGPGFHSSVGGFSSKEGRQLEGKAI